MISVIAIVFAVLKVLHNLVSMQKSLFENYSRRKPNNENCPGLPNLFFTKLSEAKLLCKNL